MRSIISGVSFCVGFGARRAMPLQIWVGVDGLNPIDRPGLAQFSQWSKPHGYYFCIINCRISSCTFASSAAAFSDSPNLVYSSARVS
jgi:hypothetical protein